MVFHEYIFGPFQQTLALLGQEWVLVRPKKLQISIVRLPSIFTWRLADRERTPQYGRQFRRIIPTTFQ